MGKSRTSKMRGYASLLGAKVPYKVKYDSKKCPPKTAVEERQKTNESQVKCSTLTDKMQ